MPSKEVITFWLDMGAPISLLSRLVARLRFLGSHAASWHPPPGASRQAYSRRCCGEGRLMDGTTRRRRLPPRWFIRVAWAAHRAIHRLTGGRRGLWLVR